MYAKIMAADSSMFVRGTSPNAFKACIGVCISIGEPEELTENYLNYFKNIKKKHSFKSSRNVFKSYDIKKFFPIDDYFKILEDFFKKMCETSEFRMHFVFSSFKKELDVNLYDGYSGSSKKVTAPEFLDILNQYFPYISIWKTSKVAKLHGTKVFLDGFTGQITRAWNELESHHEATVIPRGDQCNIFISVSDLITRYIDLKMREGRIKLDMKAIKKLLTDLGGEEPKAYHCGVKDLRNIVPINKSFIPMDRLYVKPMVFVLKEGIITDERNWIEQSEVHQKLLSFAESKNGGLKYIDYGQDSKNLRKDDFIAYIGDEGEKQANYIVNKLGYPATIISASEI